MKPVPRLAAAAFLLGTAACFRAPEIVVVDRATALEEQASGSFEDLERKLARAGIAPRPVPFTPEQLEALGIHEGTLVNGSEMTDADRLDRLLEQRCVGEGNAGLLVETPAACRGAADAEVTQRLVERTNGARAQLWRWLAEQRPNAKPDALRSAWQAAHARGIACGAWMQKADGTWEAKKC